MSKVSVLLEVNTPVQNAFSLHAAQASSALDAFEKAESLIANLPAQGLDVVDDIAPIPMFDDTDEGNVGLLAAFGVSETNDDMRAKSMVVSCEVNRKQLANLDGRDDVIVWPNSPVSPLQSCQCGAPDEQTLKPAHLFDQANSANGVDCRPFRPGATIADIRQLLGTDAIWQRGFRGQNMVVGIIDEGVNGEVYPVVGGFSAENAKLKPGEASITSHGSMCAADVLVAAPAAKLYDYPFLGIANSGGVMSMLQAILNQRRIDGTPHLSNNSYGYTGIPSSTRYPRHEIWDINHPVNRKVREVVASGCPALYAAGNCGEQCPSGNCHPSGIGRGDSIHAANSLKEVITVAAVNSRHERVGYSSQGPGIFEHYKPDVAGYTHLFANFGPGRPGGTRPGFDSGTSAATPVVAGVAALLMSAFPHLTPEELKSVLIMGAYNLGTPGWDADTGYGVINAAASYFLLQRGAL
ncbi:S8 family peptidase [Alteromonas sp. RKMC-009]|uniref:S8 family peptidase n=1 Tax=Alteromonas sp. RKMC-009 TaxID=2267264 RepID=UPI000E6924D5|nr:S8 family serine peptidase [Alteromonas sp. RKMC-009]AYA64942.1 hypothetical protein DS731_13480 [Alteromonas sp. RKMC-009]